MRLNSFLILSLFSLFSFSASAKLLDKIVAIVDDRVISLSEIKRIVSTNEARRVISPDIYKTKTLKQREAVKILVHGKMIREKLNSMGYVITDEQVEEQIRATEKRLRLNRDALMQFLSSRGLTFDEYFEIIRSTIEHQIFVSRVIRPLISITEQEIKNEFYRENLKNKALSFKYTLVDFSISKSKVNKKMLKNFKPVLEKFQINGNLPSNFGSLETNVLGDITEDGLTDSIKRVLKGSQEGGFTKPVLLGGDYHVFFVKKKDLVESQRYLKEKNRIKAKLFAKVFHKVTQIWFQREENKHYLKYFI